MHPAHLLAYFFGGAFLINVIPHLVAGVMGEAFQSPFATPPGEGLSSSNVNILWSFVNLAIAYLLLLRVGSLDLHNPMHAAVLGLGMLGMALILSRSFSRFHGGLDPAGKQ